MPLVGALLSVVAITEVSTASLFWLHDEEVPKSMRK